MIDFSFTMGRTTSRRITFASLGTLMLACTLACSSSSDEAPTDYGAVFDLPKATAPNADTIEGLWELVQTQSAAGVTVESHSRVLIKNAEIRMANRCSSEGYETVTVGISVPATIEPAKATVSGSGGSDEKTTTAEGKPPVLCKVEIRGPGALTYTVGSGKLVFGALNYEKIGD